MEQTVFTGQKPPAPRNYKHFGSRCRTCHVGDGCPPPNKHNFRIMGTKKLWQFPYGVGGGFKYFSICEIFTQKFGGRFYFLGRNSRLLTIEKQKKIKICLKPPTAPPERRCTFTSWDRRRVIGCHFVSCVDVGSTWSTWGFFFSEKGGANQWGETLCESWDFVFF